MKVLGVIISVLLIIGGLNWGAIGLFDVNFIQSLFSGSPAVEKIIYILVGIAAILHIICMFCCCKKDHDHTQCCK